MDLDLLRCAAKQQGMNQPVAGLVHGQRSAKVRVAALAQAADLKRCRNGLRLAAPMRDQAAAIGREGHRVVRRGAASQRPQRSLRQAGAQDGVQRRKQRPSPLGGEDGVGVDLLVHAGVHLKAQAASRGRFTGIAGAALVDQLLVSAPTERRVDHMLIAQARHLLGLEALVERLLDVDDAQLAGQGMEGVGVGCSRSPIASARSAS
ncbi:hypothetical protein [Aquabacterium sp.]|uniref:hypothetical protein n=1 Tax=Aquabacterium sp. TaxID=1872578 RepID=UPI00351D91DC